MKIRPVGTELLHANGRTDRQDRQDEGSSRFSQICAAWAGHITKLRRPHCFSPDLYGRVTAGISIQTQDSLMCLVNPLSCKIEALVGRNDSRHCRVDPEVKHG